MESLDPEAAFFASKKQTGNEWELYKENVRPLKRGRNVNLLNKALLSHADNALKKSLLDTRRRYIEAIEEYSGDDPLQPWIDCIKWVQESFPMGGDQSGLVVIYEQCVRAFWDQERYKDDLRYLKVWLEYAENCVDAEVIYNFLEANQIGVGRAVYYSKFAAHMEAKRKFGRADEIFNLGIARKAKPLEKLEDAYKSFLVRSTRNKPAEDGPAENQSPVRNFGSVLTIGGASRRPSENPEVGRKRGLRELDTNVPMTIYKDANPRASRPPVVNPKSKENSSWNALATRSERNKENTSVPAKWVSYKVPQKPGALTRAAAPIEIFVDEKCAKLPSVEVEVTKSPKPSVLQIRRANSQSLKSETELLKENPLRNFNLNNLR